MGYEELHQYSTGESQTIALIDSGVSAEINFDADKAFPLVGNDIYDYNGHGTMMYSIIKGYKNQIVGISPDADILSIKILENDEPTSPEIIKEAINLAINQGATIINLSVGSNKDNDDIAAQIKKATNNNITVIASSGDYSNLEVMFPANMEEVISVGAIGENLEPLDMTSGSDLTTINAPGDNIKSIDHNLEPLYSSGTSQANAIISGYVALLKDYAASNNKFISNNDIAYYLGLIKDGSVMYSDVFNEITK